MKSKIKKLIPKPIFSILVNKYHWLMALKAYWQNGRPTRGMRVIGVTGTAGKSTTTFMLAHILEQNGSNVAFFTTAGGYWGKEHHLNPSRKTTESPDKLYSRIKEAKLAGDDTIILETTAHAVAQHRVAFMPFAGSLMTNFSHDHLDYFKTMDRYFAAKKQMFELTAKRGGWGVMNADNEYGESMTEPIERSKLLSYGKKGDVKPRIIKETADATVFEASYQGEKHTVTIGIPGRFNVDNALAAIAAGIQTGLSFKACCEAMNSFKGVTGRMERIVVPNGAVVVIDYAHTPDSFEKVLKELRPLAKERLIAVFGGYGERDSSIRGPLGKIAGQYCDRIFLTEDDPRSESIESINSDLKAGIAKGDPKGRIKITEINVREEAMLAALKESKKDDVLAFLGKGHERTIEYATGPKPWNERAAAEAAIDLIAKN